MISKDGQWARSTDQRRRPISTNGVSAFGDTMTCKTMLADFEADELDAVVFDGPILAYYVRTKSDGNAQLLERVYKPENYGMAFPTSSNLREDVDQAMLRLREDGTYNELLIKWFGAAYARR